MDLWNNRVGREIARDATSKADLARRVADALQNGELITNPDPSIDSREYDEERPDVDPSLLEDLYLRFPEAFDDSIDRAIQAFVPVPFLRLFLPISETQGGRPILTGGDPLVVDLNGDGVALIAQNDSSVSFDFIGDGIARQMGWVAPGDAFLVHDINGDGEINDVTEMFGTPYGLSYLLSTIQQDIDEHNGFAALGIHDSNDDGTISSLDVVWSELAVWQDVNSNGVTDPGELISLDDAGVSSIDVSAIEHLVGGNWPIISGEQIEGHWITHRSTVSMQDGSTHEIVDAWLNTDLMNTYYSADYTLDVRTLFLPTLRGYGQLPDLHISASLNNGPDGLLEQLQSFATTRTYLELFSEFGAVRNEVEEILYRWAGIDRAAMEASPNFGSNGLYGLMPEYHFVRTIMGQNNDYNGTWLDFTGWLPTVSDGVGAIHETFQNLVDAFSARLVFQSGGDALFEGGLSYNPFSDEFQGEFALSQASIDALETSASSHADVQGYWNNVARFIDGSIGLANVSPGDLALLDSAANASSAGSLSWADILATLELNLLQVPEGGTSIAGTAYDDEITGSGTNNTLDGGMGDDTLIGLDSASAGTDDIYIGGEGNDIYLAGLGNDVFQYDDGDDIIVLGSLGGDISSPSQTLRFGAGISPDDVSFQSLAVQGNTPNLSFHVFKVEGRGTITVQFPGTQSFPNLIDEFHFEDGTVLTFEEIPASFHGDRHDNNVQVFGREEAVSETTLYGYDGDDDLSLQNGAAATAWVYGGAGNDTLSARVDNDALLYGGTGNDTYIVGAGDEHIYYESGRDFIRGIDGQFAGNSAHAGIGHEVIVMPEGISGSDLSFWRVNTSNGSFDDLQIDVSDLGSITIRSQFLGSQSATVEQVQFADGSMIDLDVQSYIILGTQGDDRFGTGYGWPTHDDVYKVNGGNDTIQDSEGQDVVLFSEGIKFEDLNIFKRGYDPANSNPFRGTDLFIKYGDAHSVEIEFYEYGPYLGQDYAVEMLRFADGSEVSLLDIEIEVHGTDAAENLSGVRKDASPNDVMFGYGGDDDLYGGAGDDRLTGGSGDDFLSGDDGEDEAVFSGKFADYEITESGALIYVTDNTGSDGTDTLYQVERITFSDGFLSDGTFTAYSDIYTHAPQIVLPELHVPFDPIRQFVSEVSQGAITTIDVLDDDLTNGDTLHFTLFGEDADQFSIHDETGTIRLDEPLTNPFGSYDGDAVYELIVMVEDLSGMVDFVEVDYLLFVGG